MQVPDVNKNHINRNIFIKQKTLRFSTKSNQSSARSIFIYHQALFYLWPRRGQIQLILVIERSFIVSDLLSMKRSTI